MDNDILEEGILYEKDKPKFLLRPFFIWASLFLAGGVIKLMHWPGGNLLLTVCGAGLHAYCFSGTVNNQKRNILNTVGTSFGFIWICFVGWMIVDEDIHVSGFNTYIIVFMVYSAFYIWPWKDR